MTTTIQDLMRQHSEKIHSHYTAGATAMCAELIAQLAAEYGFSQEEACEKFLPTEEPKAAKLSKKSGKKTSKKSKKDPSKPKKAKNPYFLFTAAKRAELKETNPDAKPTEIAKLLGAAWEECKQTGNAGPYEEAAEADKRRYEEEMAAWTAKQSSDSEAD